MKNRIRTKIVATIGPATNNVDKIKELIEAGVNVFRMNFSHGSHEEHYQNLQKIREAASQLNTQVGVLQDLSGPKIRITELSNENLSLKTGETVNLCFGEKLSDTQNLYVSILNPAEILKEGNTVLLADGIISLQVLEVKEKTVTCKIQRGSKLRSRIGIAFPDSKVNLPATTEKDIKDFEWGLENKVDFFAISFVQDRNDVKTLTSRLQNIEALNRPLVISKIETRTAIQNIDEILDESDGIMVARGDLGVELPVESLPSHQKELITKANAAGKPVIVATQMLHSMVHANRPTRAEVTDVATAVISGTDAVMLSEETAIGDFPVESVEYLNKIAFEAEKEFNFEVFKLRFAKDDFNRSVPDAISYAACAASHRMNAAAIVTCTETGYSAKLVAKYRPQQPLYGVSSRDTSLRRMCLYWGVQPILFDAPESRGAEIHNSLDIIQKKEEISDDAIAIITGGLTVRVPGATSVLEVRRFGEP